MPRPTSSTPRTGIAASLARSRLSGAIVAPGPIRAGTGQPPERASTDVDFEDVKAALAALPPRQREVVSALKLRDESVKNIGERLGMSPSAVKVTAHRGYRALRRLLGHRES